MGGHQTLNEPVDNNNRPLVAAEVRASAEPDQTQLNSTRDNRADEKLN